MEEYSLNDIADNLLIINKKTIDILFSLENGSDCVALYVFYYKTAKWQKTMSIKATDEYIKKSLKWGIDRIKKAKNILKDNGLIKVTKKTDEKGIITGWYVELSYMVEKHIQNTQCPQVDTSTSGCQETNAYDNIDIDIYNNKNKVLNNNNINSKKEIEKEKSGFHEGYDENGEYHSFFENDDNFKETPKPEENPKTDSEKVYDYFLNKAKYYGYAKKDVKPNESTLKNISKYLKEYDLIYIEQTIDRYFQVISDKSYYFDTYWNAEKFFKQGNAFKDFTEEGNKWINYNLARNKVNPYKS